MGQPRWSPGTSEEMVLSPTMASIIPSSHVGLTSSGSIAAMPASLPASACARMARAPHRAYPPQLLTPVDTCVTVRGHLTCQSDVTRHSAYTMSISLAPIEQGKPVTYRRQ